MAEIFISYASENRETARELAQAIGARGWSVWWDREIPLGKSYDEVIEKALAEAKCAIVLWSEVSGASEWVRNEASEGKRRGILIPVFIETVEAPLAFRLLNGADLRNWNGEATHAEFDRLAKRVAELLGQAASIAPSSIGVGGKPLAKFFSSRLVWGGLGIVFVAILALGYMLKAKQPEPYTNTNIDTNTAPVPSVEVPAKPTERVSSDLEKSIKDLSKIFGGAVPATSLAKGFHVPDLGLRVAFLTAEQSASTFGALPSGAVVMEVDSGRPMAKAGIHVGDIILSIAGKKITSEDELRQAIFKIGPGKTTYTYRRGEDSKTVAIECAKCEAQ